MTTINPNAPTADTSGVIPADGTQAPATTAPAPGSNSAPLEVSSDTTSKSTPPSDAKPSLAVSHAPAGSAALFGDPLAFLQFAGIEAQEDRTKNIDQLLKGAESQIDAAQGKQTENLLDVLESLDKKAKGGVFQKIFAVVAVIASVAVAAVTLNPVAIAGAALAITAAIDTFTDGAATKGITKGLNFLIQNSPIGQIFDIPELSEEAVGYIMLGLSVATIFTNPVQMVKGIASAATSAAGTLAKGIASSADELLTLASKGGSAVAKAGGQAAANIGKAVVNMLDDALKAIANVLTKAADDAQRLLSTSGDDVLNGLKNLGKGLTNKQDAVKVVEHGSNTLDAAATTGDAATNAALAKFQNDIDTAEIDNLFQASFIDDVQGDIELFLDQIKEAFGVIETIFSAQNDLQDSQHRSAKRSAQA